MGLKKGFCTGKSLAYGMMEWGRKLRFGVWCVGARVLSPDRSCPWCGSPRGICLGRKHWVLELLECPGCFLRFRYPKADPRRSFRFYRRAYRERYVTDLPPPDILASLLSTKFVGSGWDYGTRIAVLGEILPKGKVLDYGCSWGYGVWQMQQAGYEAAGFDIDPYRVAYGREQLCVKVTESLREIEEQAPFDGIIASHVFEHLPDLRTVVAFLWKVLRGGGKLLVFVPNGDGKMARSLGVAWKPMVNEKHCLALTARFFAKAFPELGFRVVFTSSPYVFPLTVTSNPDSSDLQGDELCILAGKEG
jgi:2-polyprenyl-3-methyl-5-hydroxy-6-metoxy-1,4-benzoquinol methylase